MNFPLRPLIAALASICTLASAQGANSDECAGKSGDLTHGHWVQRLQFKNGNPGFQRVDKKTGKKDLFASDGDFEITQHIPLHHGKMDFFILPNKRDEELTRYSYSFRNREMQTHTGKGMSNPTSVDCTRTQAEPPMASGQMTCLAYLQEMRKNLDEYAERFKPLSAADDATIKCAAHRLENAIAQVTALAKPARAFADDSQGTGHSNATTND